MFSAYYSFTELLSPPAISRAIAPEIAAVITEPASIAPKLMSVEVTAICTARAFIKHLTTERIPRRFRAAPAGFKEIVLIACEV